MEIKMTSAEMQKELDNLLKLNRKVWYYMMCVEIGESTIGDMLDFKRTIEMIETELTDLKQVVENMIEIKKGENDD